MNEDQFTKLFTYMQRLDAKIDASVAELKVELKADINRVYNLVDQQVKQNETDHHERLAMNRQLDRHEDWIEKAAGDLKISYDPSA